MSHSAIDQQDKQGLKTQVKLLNERTLQVEKRGKRGFQKYTIDLLALDSASKVETIFGWQWLVTGILSILLMLVLLNLLPVLDESLLLRSITYLLGLGIAGGCFYTAWKRSSRKQIFYSRNGQVPLVELAMNFPTKQAFNAFVHQLEDRIESSQREMELSMKNQLAGEMRMLRRLSEEGILSEKVYNTAKTVLLKKH
jgi:hypothetical protein